MFRITLKILIILLLFSFCSKSEGFDWKRLRRSNNTTAEPVKAIKLDIKNELSYEEIIKLSKEQDKKIFVFFYMDSCHWCHKMIDETLSDESCKEALKDYLIYYYNPENEKESKNVKMFPTYQIIDSNEKVLRKGQKFIKADEFLKWIR